MEKIICQCCGKSVIRAKAFYPDFNEDAVCENCYAENYSYRLVKDSFYSPELVFRGCSKKQATLGKKRAFGFESEVYLKPKMVYFLYKEFVKKENLIFFHEDGSIEAPYSYQDLEIVSHPMTLEYMKNDEKVKKLFSFIQKNCRTNKSTGIHIHVNKSSFSNLCLIKLAMLFTNDYAINLISEVAQRNIKNNEYCSELSKNDAKNLKENLRKNKHTKQSSKYSSINLHHTDTVEFRIFAGNNDKKAIITACEFIELCIKYVNQESMVNLENKDIYNSFKRLLKQNGSTNLKKRI